MSEDPVHVEPSTAQDADVDDEDMMDRPSDNADYIEPPLGQDALVPVIEERRKDGP